MIEFDYIEIEQPVGMFLLGKMRAKDVYNNSEALRRTDFNDGIQRVLNRKRVKDIASYCQDPDAIFPTPIILSISSKYIKNINGRKSLKINTRLMKEENTFFNIVDGQHRIEGIHASGLAEYFILPTIIILDTTIEQDAYIFSVINGNQKAVSKSLIYDLFSLSDARSVEKVCNYLVRELNTDKKSPLYGKIKMLGIKSEKYPEARVSQAMFIDALLPYISRDTSKDNRAMKKGEILEEEDENIYIFRDFFIKKQDHIIYRLLLNYFTAINKVEKIGKEEGFLEEDEIDYLNKTIGYIAKFKILRSLFVKGKEKKDLSAEYFAVELQQMLKKYKEDEEKLITNENYGSSASGANQLSRMLLKKWLENDNSNERFLTDVELKNMLMLD